MKSRIYFNGYISFDSVKRELSKAKSDLKYNKSLLDESNSQSKVSQAYLENVKSKILQLVKDISELENILTTEPPPPELPPTRPLVKVCGIIEDFSVLKVLGYFHDEKYNIEEHQQKNESNQLGSLLLAITGNATASAVIGQKQVSIASECDFVRGKVNGIPFYGWLGRTSVKNGDIVEMVAQLKGGEYIIYALTMPNLKTISITPQCNIGRKESYKLELKSAMYIVGCVFLAFGVVAFFNDGSINDVFALTSMLSVIIAIALVYSFLKSRKKIRPTIELAEYIFFVLGFSNPQKINLLKSTKNEIKNKSTDMKNTNVRELPSKNAFKEFYFYY